MFAIRKMIDSRFRWLFAVCLLQLCLAVPALGTSASSVNPEVRADDGSLIDLPEILVPKPPPPPPPSCQVTTAMEQTA